MRATLLLGLICCLGCASPAVEIPDDPGRVDGSFHLMTDDTRYVAELTDDTATFQATLTFVNSGDEVAYFTGCRPPEQPFLEKRLGDDWVRAFDPVFLMCLSAPVAVEPGERLDYTYVANAGLPDSDIHPQWLVGDVEGEYRLRWDFVDGGSIENDMDIQGGRPGTVYSNRFRVTVAE